MTKIFYTKNNILQVTFNPGLALTAIRKTKPWFQPIDLAWARHPIEIQQIISGQLQKSRDLNKLKTWTRDMVTRH